MVAGVIVVLVVKSGKWKCKSGRRGVKRGKRQVKESSSEGKQFGQDE